MSTVRSLLKGVAMNTTPPKALTPIAAAVIAACAFGLPTQSQAASLAISQVPLYLGGTVEPNIMFVLDDSGSMDWSFMPDDIYSFHNTKRAKSSYYNKIYYDPNATYLPPLDQDGGQQAWHRCMDLRGGAARFDRQGCSQVGRGMSRAGLDDIGAGSANRG